MVKTKEDKGITLIALVITVIILLVLAVISINIAIGQNKLIPRAEQANEDIIIGKYKEKIELIKAETIVNRQGRATLDDLNSAYNEPKQGDWVNNTELNNSTIKLTTNDGYVFFVTENTTEYMGKGDVIIPETILAEEVEFTPDSSLNWTGVSNVKQALDYLYNN